MLVFKPDNIFRNATNENDYHPVNFQMNCNCGIAACLKKGVGFREIFSRAGTR